MPYSSIHLRRSHPSHRNTLVVLPADSKDGMVATWRMRVRQLGQMGGSESMVGSTRGRSAMGSLGTGTPNELSVS
jgi:hypothetical protein